MQIKVFDQTNSSEYLKLLTEFKLDLDVFYQPGFLKVEAKNLKGNFEIFTVSDLDKNQLFVYPYIKLPCHGRFSNFVDVTSPYGYAGPFCSNRDLFEFSENAFLEHMKQENVVSEFVRYHFIYNEEIFFEREISNELNRTVIVFTLKNEWDEIWKNHISMNNRNYVNRFEKDGFSLVLTQDIKELDDFITLYYQTMENAEASESFFFSKEYFYDLFQELSDRTYIAKVMKDEIVYSSVLFFVSGSIVEPFLNGRNLNYLKLPSSVPLYINLAKWAQNHNFEILNMGGGRTHASDDSLFQFKKRLSNQVRSFYIGKRIHNKKIYQDIIEDFIKENGQDKYDEVKQRLHFYR
jgi:hypothetical protein